MQIAVEEVEALRADGGNAIVDLTSGGLSPDPQGLAQISRSTGVHIVMGCGYYVEPFQPEANHDRSASDFAGEIVSQVTEGAWGTAIRAGIIGEIGCSDAVTDLERRVLEGAVIAQVETGAALIFIQASILTNRSS